MLQIAPGFSLPDATVTETLAMLAKRGMGKSNAAVVLAEEMHRIGAQFVAIDPKGDWYGIRSSADGRGPGLPVPVFGGRHGDIPLEVAAGSFIASLIVEKHITAVLDVSLFSKGDQIRFVTDFAETLFRAVGDSPRPMHLFLEEAEEFLPQRVDGRTARMVGAYSKISKQGRAFGLGVTLVTQRSASLNKDALSQTDTLVLFRTVSPHDRKAVVAWADHHGEQAEVAATLAELEPGESWILSPGFLGCIERVKWRRRSTFDSGSTPKVGRGIVAAPRSVADIDLAEIKEQMAEVVERVEANDPKALRKRVAQLERELADRPEPDPVVERVPFVPDEWRELVAGAVALLNEVAPKLNALVGMELDDGTVITKRTVEKERPPRPAPPSASATRSAGAKTGNESRPGGIPGKLLDVLARYPQGLVKRRAAALAGTSPRKSTIRNAISTLKGAGLVDVLPGDVLAITDAGRAAVGDVPPLPSGDELLDHWRDEIGGSPESAPRRVFEALVAAYPDGLATADLAERAGLDPSTSTIRNAVSTLVTLGVAERDRGVVRADVDVMEAAGR